MHDVVIIGGGPAGSTTASMLKKYNPKLDVLVLEREKFPREHVGESQLPPIGPILNEMGVWDKVEAANFPIKIGATFRWGNTRDLWDFQLYPADLFVDEPRPGKFKGQRMHTAWQVDRAIYDEILLDHSASMGAEVREETKVADIMREGDRVTGVRLEDGTIETGRYYVDATGSSGMLRRAMGIDIVEPSNLRNVAFWDYWVDADWAYSIGTGGTRILVLSIGYGWLWFIPVSDTRTSIGLVCPAEYFKNCGMTREELYAKALKDEPYIATLIKDAKPEGTMRATKDWSYYSQRMHGENWFLIGEAAGFADPILSAGLTMAHLSGKELAYTIMALDEGKLDSEWLKRELDDSQTRRVRQHIQFADFWYTANGCFTDCKEYTSLIAKEAGMSLTAHDAFQWFGSGGFIHENLGSGFSGCEFDTMKDTIEVLTQTTATLECQKFNHFTLNLDGATIEEFAVYDQGKIIPVKRWRRGDETLPQSGLYYVIVQLLQHRSDLPFVFGQMAKAVMDKGLRNSIEGGLVFALGYLESMVRGGWVIGKVDPTITDFEFEFPKLRAGIRMNDDTFVKSS
jgi:flavin-dependent dehydrogenase